MADKVQITFDDAAVKKFFTVIERQGRDAMPLMKAFVAYHLRQIIRVFQAEGKGFTPLDTEYANPADLPWKDFSKRSFGRKRPSGKKITESSKLLQDTGTLRQSFKTLIMTPTAVAWGSELSYAKDHQFGNRKKFLPARPMIFLTREDQATMREMMLRYIKDNILAVATAAAK